MRIIQFWIFLFMCFMRDNRNRLNGYGPIFIFMAINPLMWLSSFLLHIIVGTIVMFVYFSIKNEKVVWKKLRNSVLKISLFGLLLDFTAGVILTLVNFFVLLNEEIKYGFVKAFDYVGFVLLGHIYFVDFPLWLIILIIVAFISVDYLMNYYIVLRKYEIPKKDKKILALLIAICSAPYFFWINIMI